MKAALELSEHGITVNAVAPGGIATPLTGDEDVDPTTVERPGVPLGRVGGPHGGSDLPSQEWRQR